MIVALCTRGLSLGSFVELFALGSLDATWMWLAEMLDTAASGFTAPFSSRRQRASRILRRLLQVEVTSRETVSSDSLDDSMMRWIIALSGKRRAVYWPRSVMVKHVMVDGYLLFD